MVVPLAEMEWQERHGPVGEVRMPAPDDDAVRAENVVRHFDE